MEHPEDRIAALEARVAKLQERLEERERERGAGRPADSAERPVDRRSLLRGAVAGIVGAAAAPAVFASPASAADGDPVLIGNPNNTTSTANKVTGLVASNSDLPVLELRNTAAVSPGGSAQPVLRLAPSTGFIDPGVGDAGDLMVSDLTRSGPGVQGGAYLNFAHTGEATNDGEVYWGNVYTSAFASFIELLPEPKRVLDTRYDPDPRTGLKRPLGAGQVVAINLGESFSPSQNDPSINRQIVPAGLVAFGLGALVNITAVTPAAGGYLTAWPSGKRPTASVLNYYTKVTIANFSMVALSPSDSFLIYAMGTTHVLVDVIGFIVPDVGLVGPFDVSQQAATTFGAERTTRRRPHTRRRR